MRGDERPTRVASLLTVLCAGVLMSCGSSGFTGAGSPSRVDHPPSPSSTAPPIVATPTPRSPTPGVTKTISRTQQLVFLHSPSQNIACSIDNEPDGGGVRCDIRDHSFTPPPKPASCSLDWGDSFGVGRTGAASGVCHGDTVFGPGEALAYDEALRDGPFVCVSTQAAMSCRNAETGHGFSLSRSTYRTF